MTQTDQQNTQELFPEFEATGRRAWMEKAEQDLKGGDLRKLTWHPYEGFPVPPMLFREDIAALPHVGTMPDHAPFVRGATRREDAPNHWNISQIIDAADPSEAAAEISRARAGGQHAIGLFFDHELHHGASLQRVLEAGGAEGLAAWHLDGITAITEAAGADIPLEIYGGLASPVVAVMAAEAGHPAAHVEFDPLGVLAARGVLPFGMETAFRLLAESIRARVADGGAGTVFAVSGEPFHNAGASVVEELACVLASGVEYLHRLQDIGIDPGDAAMRMRVTFPVGPNFFMEIAKLRAARMLWSRIVRGFGVEDERAQRMHILARSSRWFQTRYDPWVNMLRTTVEAVAGAAGGADAMHTAPFDEVAGEPGPFSRRIARNTQLILQEESHLSQVVDPAGGSYYVETLTDAVAQHAWELFREIESRGGFVAALEDGTVQSRINATADEKRRNISHRRDILVGTSQYPNLSERPLPQPDRDPEERAQRLRNALREYVDSRGDAGSAVEVLRAAVNSTDENITTAIRSAATAGVTIPEICEILCEGGASAPSIQPLSAFRAADTFERLRNAVERAAQKPKIFLATLGPVFWRRARATFASGFFGAAGMDIIDNLGFDTPEDAARAARAAAADVVVACSDDESYRDLIPALAHALGNGGAKPLLIVAGNPAEDLDVLKEAGVTAFIHLKADAGETLATVCEQLGIDIQ